MLGARVPIILTSRADSLITRLASCAVASLVADARRKSAAAAIRIDGGKHACRIRYPNAATVAVLTGGRR